MAVSLYDNDISSCAQKVRVALEEKKLAYERRYLDLRAGDQRKPEYRRINPKGVVPALDHDGAIVTESSIILEYLEDAFPEPSLRPEAPAGRAEMRRIVKILDDKLHAMVGVLSFALAFRHEFLALPDKGKAMLEATTDPMEKMARGGLLAQGADFAGVGQALTLCDQTLTEFETLLQDRDYLLGDYSLADAAWTPYVHRLDILGLADLWAERPAVTAWWRRLRDRPSYAAAITDIEKPERVALIREKSAEAKPHIDEWRAALREAA